MASASGSSNRRWDSGTVRPYRPRPRDFRETYIRNGWDGPEGRIEEIFRTNWRVIRRWIDEEGAEALKAVRAAYVRSQGRRNLHDVGGYPIERTRRAP